MEPRASPPWLSPVARCVVHLGVERADPRNPSVRPGSGPVSGSVTGGLRHQLRLQSQPLDTWRGEGARDVLAAKPSLAQRKVGRVWKIFGLQLKSRLDSIGFDVHRCLEIQEPLRLVLVVSFGQHVKGWSSALKT